MWELVFRDFWLQIFKPEWQIEKVGKNEEEIKAQPNVALSALLALSEQHEKQQTS